MCTRFSFFFYVWNMPKKRMFATHQGDNLPWVVPGDVFESWLMTFRSVATVYFLTANRSVYGERCIICFVSTKKLFLGDGIKM